jgi:predicted ATPase/DNA-binding winged helix-turn-helix (wHTH) protein
VTDSDLSTEFAFGRFSIRPAERRLLADGKAVVLKGRAFDLLLALFERRDRVVGKSELLDLVWPGRVVEENNLQVQISMLRRILGSETIATVPGRGYRFTAVHEVAQAAALMPSPAAAQDLSQGNLPAHLPPLYGRRDDVAALTRLLDQHRVVSVVGPGGIGKTRIALAVAHGLRGAYRDGVWFVELAPLANPLLVVPTVARVLGHTVAPKEAALASLLEAMQDKDLLLVLDNCEHLLGAVADLVGRVAAGRSGVRFLVTSQEPMHLPEEQVDRLGALAVPATADLPSALNYGAVELFVARAQAADPRFTLNGNNVSAVVEICVRLDGIALAIELAAARVPLLGVLGVRLRLGQRLKLLAGGAWGALPRHQTLRAALEWSYGLLSPEERSVFDRLGVFVGSFSLEAAQHVASDDTIDAWAVLEHLAALVDKSLVLVESGDPPRYRLLESSRVLALERLAEADATDATRRRHAQAIADTLAGGGIIEGPEARMHRIGPDLDNARAAAAWATGSTGDRRIAVALAGATYKLWDVLGCNDEGDRLYRSVEPWVDESEAPLLAARYWFAVADLGLYIRMRDQAKAGFKAADLFRSLGDQYWQFRALYIAGLRSSHIGDRGSAETALREAESLLDPAWPSWARASLEFALGSCDYFAARNPHEARKHFVSGIEFGRRPGGDDYFVEWCEYFLLAIGYALSDLKPVVDRARELLDRSPTGIGGGIRSRLFVLATLGAGLTGLGDLDDAEEALRTALPQMKRSAGSASWMFNHIAFLVARQGRLEDAARLIGYVDGSRNDQSLVQSPATCRSYDEALAILAAALDPEKLGRLRAAGQEMTEGGATALAFPELK